MKKFISFLLFLFCCSFIKAEDTTTLNQPHHIIKANITSIPVGELILLYEYFNGKNRGLEIGASYIYPVKTMQYTMLQFYPTFFFSNGFSLRCSRKFYFQMKKGYVFVAPTVLIKYKSINNSTVPMENQDGSMHDINANISQDKYILSLIANVGLNITKSKNKLEPYLGLGVSIMSCKTSYHYYEYEGHGYQTYPYPRSEPHLLYDNIVSILPLIQLGIKLNFDLKTKKK